MAAEDLDRDAAREDTRRKVLHTLFLCAYAAAIVGVEMLPVHYGLSHVSKRLLLRAATAVVPLYFWVLQSMKKRIYQIGHKGGYEKALRMDRFWGALPFYGTSLRGVILFNAGRYHEALAYLRPLAFDGGGRPRLKSQELYIYALALVNDNRPGEAEPLLEAAISAVPSPASMKVALATCLLTQEKEPDRAVRLMEEAMSAPRRDGEGNRADYARRVARYAWALAASRRSQEAQARIDEALQAARSLRPEDAAGVQYFVGEAWREMGEDAKARAAFDEATRLQPTGVTALSVQKALAKMGNRWAAWQPAMGTD